jgi:CDP-diacylglycerol---glycerol-3-phosphate 3-phosphatidyltransferase
MEDKQKITNLDVQKQLIADRYLLWLVKLLPRWLHANVITLVRAITLLPIYLAYRFDLSWLAFVLFLLAWFTDIVDGMQARYRNQINDLGKRLDPAVDKIFVVGLLAIFAVGRLSWAVLGVTVGIELFIVLMAGVAAPLVLRWWGWRFKIGANIWGKIKMFLQGCGLVVLMVGLNVRGLQIVSECLFWVAAVMASISVFFYLRGFERE